MFFQGAAGPGFRAHFGGPGGFRAGGRHGHHQRGGGGGGGGEAQGQPSLAGQLMQFLPIILLILMSFSSLGGRQQQVRAACVDRPTDRPPYRPTDRVTSRAFRDLPPSAPACLPACLLRSTRCGGTRSSP